ncbi:hypothetical protein IF2G_05647 [Cordyceps javanica]|nr:hypothetical protein IF2G_05647 [Cordyceps javanica]
MRAGSRRASTPRTSSQSRGVLSTNVCAVASDGSEAEGAKKSMVVRRRAEKAGVRDQKTVSSAYSHVPARHQCRASPKGQGSTPCARRTTSPGGQIARGEKADAGTSASPSRRRAAPRLPTP